MPAADRRFSEALAEAVPAAVLGGALAGATWSLVGIGWPAAVIGAGNGAVSGWRGIYEWRARRGLLAFVLDSTWTIPMTAAAMVAHGIAALRPAQAGFIAGLSRRANRHVYAGGFRLRRGFVITVGNTVNNAGARAAWSPRRQQLVTDHEDVHVWQGRWFGPFYPVLYVGWTVVGGAVGAVIWAVRRRDQPVAKVVETCAYYLNPFEWWAYSRDGAWPPQQKVVGLGWSAPIVRPLAERPTGRLRRSRRSASIPVPR